MDSALILVAIALALVGLFVAVVALVRATGGPSLVGRTVVVHTRKPDDRTVRGVLHATYADRWTLRDAVVLLPGVGEQPLGGLQHVPVANISFAQEIEPASGGAA